MYVTLHSDNILKIRDAGVNVFDESTEQKNTYLLELCFKSFSSMGNSGPNLTNTVEVVAKQNIIDAPAKS